MVLSSLIRVRMRSRNEAWWSHRSHVCPPAGLGRFVVAGRPQTALNTPYWQWRPTLRGIVKSSYSSEWVGPVTPIILTFWVGAGCSTGCAGWFTLSDVADDVWFEEDDAGDHDPDPELVVLHETLEWLAAVEAEEHPPHG